MKRLLLCAALLIAAIPANSGAHAQQGNLPKPVQKLSPYPPVVCVTPEWRPEPCEDRNASGWHATRQLPEPVKCLKPDGAEEPCESRCTPAQPAARIPVKTKIVLYREPGGIIRDHVE